MIQKDEAQMEAAAILKAARSAIRTRHSIRADQEINDRLPGLSDAIDNALLTGKPFRLVLQEWLESDVTYVVQQLPPAAGR